MIFVVAALAFGLMVLALMSRFAKNVPRVNARAELVRPDERPVILPDEFQSVIVALLENLGLRVVTVTPAAGGGFDMTCRDSRPITGGAMLVRASAETGGGQVDAAEVLAFAEGVRADGGALKGIDIAVAGFTDEAYAAIGAAPAQVELIDAKKLVELVRERLPRRAAALERYRFFSTEGRRHSRAAGQETPDPEPGGAKPDGGTPKTRVNTADYV